MASIFRKRGSRTFLASANRCAIINFLFRKSSNDWLVMNGLTGSAPPRFTVPSNFIALSSPIFKNDQQRKIELMNFIEGLVIKLIVSRSGWDVRQLETFYSPVRIIIAFTGEIFSEKMLSSLLVSLWKKFIHLFNVKNYAIIFPSRAILQNIKAGIIFTQLYNLVTVYKVLCKLSASITSI